MPSAKTLHVHYTLHVSIPDFSFFTPGSDIAALPKLTEVIEGEMEVPHDGDRQDALRQILEDYVARVPRPVGVAVLPGHIQVKSFHTNIIERAQ